MNFLIFLHNRVSSFLKNRIERYISKKEGGQMYSPTLRKLYKINYGVNVGYGSYGGCFSHHIPKGVSFGNYCSIAPTIRIFRANHPLSKFTTHPILYNPSLGYVKEDMLDRPVLEIGHDVWIGEWVIILPSVTKIGNGSIIGAGSIVTKNVESYTIVAGNPAKFIKNRFDVEIINKIEKSRWWEMKKKELVTNIEYFNSLVKND